MPTHGVRSTNYAPVFCYGPFGPRMDASSPTPPASLDWRRRHPGFLTRPRLRIGLRPEEVGGRLDLRIVVEGCGRRPAGKIGVKCGAVSPTQGTTRVLPLRANPFEGPSIYDRTIEMVTREQMAEWLIRAEDVKEFAKDEAWIYLHAISAGERAYAVAVFGVNPKTLASTSLRWRKHPFRRLAFHLRFRGILKTQDPSYEWG